MKRASVLRRFFILAALLALLLLAASTAGAGQEGPIAWHCWHPDPLLADPCERTIRDVEMLSDGSGWAVGELELLLSWDGLRWSQHHAPAGANFYDVEMLSPLDGWAVGRYAPGAPLLLHWDGASWTETAPSWLTTGVSVVDILAAGDVWAGGAGGLLHWDGAAWAQVAVPDPASPAISDLDMVTAHDGWAIGGLASRLWRWNGSAFVAYDLPQAGVSLASVDAVAAGAAWARGWDGSLWHWDGAAWRELPAPDVVPGYDDTFAAVQLVGPNAGWAAVSYQIYYWNGASWQHHSALTTVSSLHMLSADLGLAAGSYGRIYRWDGTVWHGLPAAPAVPLSSMIAVDALAADDLWAAGANGTLLHYDGVAWSQLDSPTTTWFSDIDMLSPVDGWAVGSVFVHWDGVSWTEVPAPGGASDVEMLSPGDGWAVSGKDILHWNGVAWATTPLSVSATDYHLSRISMVSSVDGWAAGYTEDSYGYYDAVLLHWDGATWTYVALPPALDGYLLDVEMVSATDGWLIVENRFGRWDGSSWTEVPNPSHFQLWDVEMAGPGAGWAVGDSGVILYWDGTAWAIAASPVASRLADLAVVSASVAFASGHIWSPGGNATLVWDGHTWSNLTPPPPPNPANNYKDVAFEPSGTGWAVGELTNYGGVATRWTGTEWQAVFLPARQTLLAVAAAAPDDAWAIGDFGGAFHWDGQRWTQWPFLNAPLHSYYAPAISMTSEGLAWAVVESKLWHWDGAAWVLVPFDPALSFRDVHMLTATDGWLVGAGGLVRHWDGHSWTPVATSFSDDVAAVEAAGPDDIWVLAGSAVYRRQNGAWDQLTIPWNATDLAVRSAADAWLIGFQFTLGSPVAARTAHWDGTAWTERPLPLQTVFLPGQHPLAIRPDGQPWLAAGWQGLLYYEPYSGPTHLFLPVLARH